MHSSMVEQFPDVLPDTTKMVKKWVWKEETNTLEQVNGGLQLTADKQMAFNKSKKSAKQSSPGMKILQSAQKKGNILPLDRKGTNAIPLNSSIKVLEKRSITLNDVKDVSYSILLENNGLPEIFQETFRNNHLDGLLASALYYFKCYFDCIALKTKPNTMAPEPSIAEKKATLIASAKVESVKKLLSEKYCSLILGLESKEHHHVMCGSRRKSFTNRDRKFFETLYSYCCLVVWITFKRKHLEIIKNELGRLFRSDAFNSYCDPADQKEFILASDLTCKDIRDVKFEQPQQRVNKRPPISSVINQRSPVLVALFPTSKDTSPWLLERRKRNSTDVTKEEIREETFDEEIVPAKLKIGIIGEMSSGFNPFTLAPFGDDGEEEGVAEFDKNLNGGASSKNNVADEEKSEKSTTEGGNH